MSIRIISNNNYYYAEVDRGIPFIFRTSSVREVKVTRGSRGYGFAMRGVRGTYVIN